LGWWKVQGTDDLVGDDVFALMRDAAEEVLRRYKSEFDRAPTCAEWERLLQDALEPIDALDSDDDSDESLFMEGGRPKEVKIVLEELTVPKDDE
jgi:hypothetical protein